ncbi:hypothetical protein TARUN_3028 [Trichoderma arundinaceum]|uniref:Uncharacterized protein n=1 Tax=Trichoderma arundinaceum TaxID=490622 RepID=A0A395NTP8_TRIAR|nr:hypothetical protein TARUN_3028 [Trichoderma arundinaceum]
MISRSRATSVTSIDELISCEFETVREIQNTRERVEGNSQALDGVFTQLATAERLLAQVKGDHRLQTAVVEEQVRAVLDLTREVKKIVGKLTRSPLGKFTRYKFSDNDRYNEQLNDLNSRFNETLSQASLQVSAITINVSERQEGYHASLNVRSHTNTKMNAVSDANAVPRNLPGEQHMVQHTASIDPIQNQPTVREAIEQDAPQTSNNHKASEILNNAKGSAEAKRASIYENKVTGTMQIITGNIGFESGYEPTFNGLSTIHNNTMGAGAKIITGDVGGEAAIVMMKDFWK